MASELERRPTAPILGVSERHGRRILGAYKWGLVPSWAKNPAAVTGTFNAAAESVATKPMFRSAFERRRILVPVDAFYEWQKLGPKEKQPYVFQRADGQPVVFAGLREWWRDAEGQELRSATIITTEAGPDMPIHNREPVVLEPENWDLWLDPGLTGGAELARLLAPTAAGTSSITRWARRSGAPAMIGPSCSSRSISTATEGRTGSEQPSDLPGRPFDLRPVPFRPPPAPTTYQPPVRRHTLVTWRNWSCTRRTKARPVRIEAGPVPVVVLWAR